MLNSNTFTRTFLRSPEVLKGPQNEPQSVKSSHDLYSEISATWQDNPVLRTIGLDSLRADLKNVLEKVPGYEQRTNIFPNLPVYKRPILTAAIVRELALGADKYSYNDRGWLIPSVRANSPTLSLLCTSYLHSEKCAALESAKFRQVSALLKECGSGELPADKLAYLLMSDLSVTGALRNVLLANSLENGILKDTPFSARIALSHFTYDSRYASALKYSPPTFPDGLGSRNLVSLVIALVERGSDLPVTYLDYSGHGHESRLGYIASGEGLENTFSIPAHHRTYSALRADEVLEAITHAKTDAFPAGPVNEARTRINVHRHMVRHLADFMEDLEGLRYPSVITGVEDLSIKQIESTIEWAAFFRRIAEKKIDYIGQQEIRVGTGLIYTPFQGIHARVECSQPSTRTVTAASDALKALGANVEIPNLTSRAKGEGLESEGYTLTQHSVDVVLRRDPSNEREAETLRSLGDTVPVHISLGGNLYHPTQTLGEIMVLMELDGLRSSGGDGLSSHTVEKLNRKPRKITFASRFDQKRADKALAEFILKHLPNWSVEVLVPTADDLPEGMEIPEGANFSTKVVSDMTDQDALGELFKNSWVVYASNAEATSKVNEKGSGQGKEKPLIHITPEALGDSYIMHPLPASQELDPRIFQSGRSLIGAQMEYKVYIIASLVAHQLTAKKARASI